MLLFLGHCLPGSSKQAFEERAIIIVTELSLLNHGVVLPEKHVALPVFLIISLLLSLSLLFFSSNESLFLLILLIVILALRLIVVFFIWRFKRTVFGMAFTVLVFTFLTLFLHGLLEGLFGLLSFVLRFFAGRPLS